MQAVIRLLYMCRMNRKELKEYFDMKVRSLHTNFKIDEKWKRLESKFKFKFNRKQFEFNCDIKEDVDTWTYRDLLFFGKMIIRDIECRNKLIRTVDNSPAGWVF